MAISYVEDLAARYYMKKGYLVSQIAEILQEYEGLVEEDIQACLIFAAKSLESPVRFART